MTECLSSIRSAGSIQIIPEHYSFGKVADPGITAVLKLEFVDEAPTSAGVDVLFPSVPTVLSLLSTATLQGLLSDYICITFLPDNPLRGY